MTLGFQLMRSLTNGLAQLLQAPEKMALLWPALRVTFTTQSTRKEENRWAHASQQWTLSRGSQSTRLVEQLLGVTTDKATARQDFQLLQLRNAYSLGPPDLTTGKDKATA